MVSSASRKTEGGIHARFTGAKIALLCGPRLLTYQRDQKQAIPFPGLGDLPGGGREGDEDPIDCALRELDEEFGLRLGRSVVIWSRAYAGQTTAGPISYFLVGSMEPAQIQAISFGNEGQRWRMMKIQSFLTHRQAVPPLQQRLAEFLREAGPSRH